MKETLLALPVRRYKTVADAQVGESHSWTRRFTQVDTHKAGAAFGDWNPIHYNEGYAALTRFKRPIVHAVSLEGEISRVLGMEFPGRGTIYVDKYIKNRAPVYHDDTVHFLLSIAEIKHQWEKMYFDVRGTVNATVVLEGKLQILLGPDIPVEGILAA